MVSLRTGDLGTQVKKMTTRSFDDRFKTKLPTFHRIEGNNFRLWKLRHKAVSHGKLIGEALV